MKKSVVIVGAVIVVVGLIAAAFLAGRYLPGSNAAVSAAADNPGSAGNRVMVLDQGSGPVRISFAEPAELPDEPSLQVGVFVRREDNSVFVGTGAIEVGVEAVNDEVIVSADYDGPVVELVVTGDTTLYEDVTEIPVLTPDDVARGELVVTRTVRAASSLDGLSENMLIRVWGEQRGDRIIATVLVYEPIK
jgi:hypothetical protein